jgi:Raf kinase inhibitor-like YbhB/YbcL family protein
MRLTTTAFQQGGAIPRRFSPDGEDISPELSWSGVPEDTESFVLIMHDPDAPRDGGFTHWVLFNIPPNVTHIPEDIAPDDNLEGIGTHGKNDSGKAGYVGPHPPSGTHRYYFRLSALRDTLKLRPGASHAQVRSAMQGLVLAQADIMGTYSRAGEKAA